MKYYFFSYRVVNPLGEFFESAVCDKHPFEKIKDLRESTDEYDFTLLFFTEISHEEYKNF